MILTFGISLGYNFEKRQLYLVSGFEPSPLKNDGVSESQLG